MCADPFVKISLGNTSYRTKVKPNAEGSAVFGSGGLYIFLKEDADPVLKLAVYNADILSNDVLGEGEVKLSKQPYCETVGELQNLTRGIPFDLVDCRTGRRQGTVFLAFAASVTHVKVHQEATVSDVAVSFVPSTAPTHVALQAAAKPASNVESLDLGTRVMIHSLQSMPLYNGLMGTVHVFLDNEKVGVMLDCDQEAVHSFHRSKITAIKREVSEKIKPAYTNKRTIQAPKPRMELVEPHRLPVTMPLKIGTRVRVHSMNAAPEYNGQIGTVDQFLQSGRVGVLLDDDPNSIVIFKPGKLEGLPPSMEDVYNVPPERKMESNLPTVALPTLTPPGLRSSQHASSIPTIISPNVASSAKKIVSPDFLSSPPAAPAPTTPPAPLSEVHVKVFSISNFKDTAGWLDKTGKPIALKVVACICIAHVLRHDILRHEPSADPFVQIMLGKASHKTKVQNNAGGTAVFDEIFSFHPDADMILKVVVYDSDTLSADVLGKGEIDLSQQPQCKTVEELRNLSKGLPFKLVDSKTREEKGTVFLAFAHAQDSYLRTSLNAIREIAPPTSHQKPPSPAAHSEPLSLLPQVHVKVFSISNFKDEAGWMDTTGKTGGTKFTCNCTEYI